MTPQHNSFWRSAEMFKGRQGIMVFAMALFLLLTLLATPGMAVKVTVYRNKVVQLDERQVELLKRQPGVYYLKLPPEKLLEHYTLVELPDELGGGFLIATAADLAAGLEAVGALSRSEARKIALTAPSKNKWFPSFYFIRPIT